MQQNLASEEGDEKLIITFKIYFYPTQLLRIIINRLNDMNYFKEKGKYSKKLTLFFLSNQAFNYKKIKSI